MRATWRSAAHWPSSTFGTGSGEITTPVLVVAGAQDRATPLPVVEQIASGVVHGRLVVLEGVAHLAPIEAPADVAGLIRQHALGDPARDDMTMAKVREAGLAVRREVLGEAHVNRAIQSTTDLTRDFQQFITEYAWGGIWTRPGLDRRSRSLVTLTALVAHGHHEELAMHLRAARTNGVTMGEIKEVLLQTAVYCGVPAANTAFRIAQQVLGDGERTSEPMTTGSFVYAATRTPFGRFGGALAEVRPDDLGATVVTGLLDTVPALDPASIGDVVWGNANGAGEDNRNVGRMAVLLAGLPVSVPATTVNRLCGSSLDAVIMASRTVESGDADLVLAGGCESMTRAPWVLPKPSRAYPAGDATAVSTTLGWRLVNSRMPAEWTVSLGEANEQLQERFGISRERQDEFALSSHRRADEAWDRGLLRQPGGPRSPAWI